MKGGRRVRVRAWALVRFPAAPRSLARPGGGTVPGGGGGVGSEAVHRRPAATAGGAGEAEPVLPRRSLILTYRKKSALAVKPRNTGVKLSREGLQQPPDTLVFSPCQ